MSLFLPFPTALAQGLEVSRGGQPNVLGLEGLWCLGGQLGALQLFFGQADLQDVTGIVSPSAQKRRHNTNAGGTGLLGRK